MKKIKIHKIYINKNKLLLSVYDLCETIKSSQKLKTNKTSSDIGA